MKLPNKIEPCPIKDAVVEIRFQPLVDRGAVFGMIYSALRDQYEKVEALPLLQLPKNILDSDPALRNKAHYRIKNDEFVVQIGPDVLSISSFPVYKGWSLFLKEILQCLDKVNDLHVVGKIERVGLRYISEFSDNILDKINLNVVTPQITGSAFGDFHLSTMVSQSYCCSQLQLVSGIYLKDGRRGTCIDIDSFKQDFDSDFMSSKDVVLQKMHNAEKELFFSLLKSEFMKTLSPEYDDE